MKSLLARYLSSKAFLHSRVGAASDPSTERRLRRVVDRHKDGGSAVALIRRSIAAQPEDVLQPLYAPSVYFSSILDDSE
ncbi:MAG: hypothetical protein JWN69_1411 [Alphaproteobacteria bacterium]|nr:hypothetical protein [Alphaproteobacteria bacterium]